MIFLLHYNNCQINNHMENIYIDFITKSQHKLNSIKKVHYQPAGNSFIVLHQQHISVFTYLNKMNNFKLIFTHGPIEELENNQILLIEWLVDIERVLCIGKDGSIFTVSMDGEVDIKAQNQDGIIAATVSPTQQYLYVFSQNKSLIQLNKQFDLVNQIAIDENQEVVTDSLPHFSWKADGSYFVLNYQTVKGNKAVTKDLMMVTFISPAKSDPNQDGLVQSISQVGRKNVLNLVSWQPSGSVIAGVDYTIKGQQKQFRVIFWQKNGLRHLEFNLIDKIQSVNQLFWSLDSSVLFVKVKLTNGLDKLLIYYRANYHWFLKDTINLGKNDFCLSLNCQKHKRHKLLIVSSANFEIIQYSIKNSEKEWKSQQKQQQNEQEFVYFVDGNIINVTDISKCLMPPPMSMFKHNVGHRIMGVSKKGNYILAVTEQDISLIDLVGGKIVNNYGLNELSQKVFGVQLITVQPLKLTLSGNLYVVVDQKLIKKQRGASLQDNYIIKTQQQTLNFITSYQNQQLKINDNILCQECTSFIFYHQFLLFTVSTSDMYDKLFVINLLLDQWIHNQSSNFKEKLAEYCSKDLLNHRLIQRGSKILGVSKGRVAFQLPRGNLQGIYPKIIMINQVKKKIAQKQYRQAFEIIRTHKLDFNILYDINSSQFMREVQEILKDIKRVDYINLFVSQIAQNLSSQLQYALSPKTLQEFQKDFEINLNGKKIKPICRAVSETLRKIGKEDYILSIFTSEIKQGRLNQVLFEIKKLKENDVEVVIPPHLVNNGVEKKKEKKKISSQQILEYVCWLVDANAIYEAALLTYDLQLAAMTARCTQKDPKQYIPYLQGLKQIENQVEYRKKICLDLKRYQIAVKQLSNGNIQQRTESLQLIKKHKLYKHGLVIYADKQELRKVKQLMIEQLSATGQVNEAYRVCQSIGEHQRALQMAKNSMDTKKIKECLEIIYKDQSDRVKAVFEIIDRIKDDIKNKVELARLYVYVGLYQQAVSIYLRHNQYRKAYKYLWYVSQPFRQKQMKEGFKLCFSIKKNQIVKDRKEFLQKYTRLLKVHKHKAQFGEVTSFKPRENDDMYSEVSVNSKSQSNYTMSTTTGMRKKKDKKRSILTRNVKEGSLLQEQYLLAYMKSLEDKVQQIVKDSKLLIQHLICMNLVEQAEVLRNQVKQYITVFNSYKIKSFAQTKYQELHPQATELYHQQRKISQLKIDSFNYLF